MPNHILAHALVYDNVFSLVKEKGIKSMPLEKLSCPVLPAGGLIILVQIVYASPTLIDPMVDPYQLHHMCYHLGDWLLG